MNQLLMPEWYKQRPQYEYQKSLAVEFYGECGVCLRPYRGSPAAHHFVVPKNYTRSKKRNVNWWWNLAPVDQCCHSQAHGMRDELIARLYVRLGELAEDGPIWGREWLEEQLALQNFKIHISLPLTK